MSSANENLIQVVSRLGDLSDELTFIGGSTISLYLTEPAHVSVRPTDDVDSVVETTHVEYDEIREKLRKKGFNERPQEEVICRFFASDELILDVMPEDPRILGFTNRWYTPAMKNRIQFVVGGRKIWAFTPVYLLASKIEAFNGRGKNNFYESHDFEDIVNLLDGRPELSDEIKNADPDVRNWVQSQLTNWLSGKLFGQAVEGHISDFVNSGGRRETVLSRMRAATEK